MEFISDLEKSMKTTYYYQLELSIITFGDSKNNFHHTEVFENENLLEARKQAFEQYNNHLAGIDNTEYFKDKKIIAPSENIELYKTAAFSVELFFVVDSGLDKDGYSLTDYETQLEGFEIEQSIFNELGLTYPLN